MHFVLRDLIFDHYTYVSKRYLSGHEVLHYFGRASAIILTFFSFMAIYMYILGATVKIPQIWLQTLTVNCPDNVEFAKDESGNYVADKGFFFHKHILKFTFYFFILGLYLG